MITYKAVCMVGAHALPVEMVYDEADPFCVTFIFHDLFSTTQWSFDYELLSEALKEDSIVGQGDIRFYRNGLATVMRLENPDEGMALIEFHTEAIQNFYNEIQESVAAGVDSFELTDEEIEEFFREAA